MYIINKFHRIYNRLYNMFSYIIVQGKRHQLNILEIDQSIDYVISNQCSVSRYGDGELDMVFRYLNVDVPEVGFQIHDSEIERRLFKLLTEKEPLPNHIIGLPCCISHGVFKFRWEDMRYWQYYVTRHLNLILSIVPKGRTYCDAYMTRFYMPWREKKKAKDRITKLKQIWDDRDLLIVEGTQTRLGVGNDIFVNAKSIKRILAPAKNAFSRYDEILKTVLEQAKSYQANPLILLALGPTATLMAYDLCKEGYQAIDIGHIDIEYEWMLMGAKKKIAVKGKFVNEVDASGNVDDVTNETYKAQIVSQII